MPLDKVSQGEAAPDFGNEKQTTKQNLLLRTQKWTSGSLGAPMGIALLLAFWLPRRRKSVGFPKGNQYIGHPFEKESVSGVDHGSLEKTHSSNELKQVAGESDVKMPLCRPHSFQYLRLLKSDGKALVIDPFYIQQGK